MQTYLQVTGDTGGIESSNGIVTGVFRISLDFSWVAEDDWAFKGKLEAKYISVH